MDLLEVPVFSWPSCQSATRFPQEQLEPWDTEPPDKRSFYRVALVQLNILALVAILADWLYRIPYVLMKFRIRLRKTVLPIAKRVRASSDGQASASGTKCLSLMRLSAAAVQSSCSTFVTRVIIFNDCPHHASTLTVKDILFRVRQGWFYFLEQSGCGHSGRYISARSVRKNEASSSS